LCSATFEQLLAFGATFCGFTNLEQVLPVRAIFEQNIGLEHISSTKKSTISWKTVVNKTRNGVTRDCATGFFFWFFFFCG